MAGTSAILEATLRCLMQFYDIAVQRRVQPSLALSVESDELGIGAGLQDRVIQVYEGLVAMDFDEQRVDVVDGFECGHYTPMEEGRLPPLYIAYRSALSGPTERVHNDLRSRFRRGDRHVVDAMARLAALVPEACSALDRHDPQRLGQLIDENFELRRSICQIPAGQLEMVERARKAGATAKFAGSGGAIIGTCPEAEVFQRLKEQMTAIGCELIRPIIGG